MFMRVIGFATCSPSSSRLGFSDIMVHDPERCRRHVPGDAAFTLDHERRESSDRVAELIAPFMAVNTGAQVLARADVLGCEERTVRPNGGLLRGVPHISNSGSLTSNPSDA